MDIRAASSRPLIPAPGPPDGRLPPRWQRSLSLFLVAAVTLVTFSDTPRNGFLQVGFDDAIVTDTEALRALTWSNLTSLATSFNHAHYVPLTMLSLAADFHFWGLDPAGYHLANVLLHTASAVLACVFLWPITPSLGAATVAALIFAVHPVQMEAVSLAIQRKTVLSGALFFLTLIAFLRWRRTGSRLVYAGSVLIFAAAALAKPAVVTLPLVLWLYEYTFVDGRPGWRDKLPFIAIGGGAGIAAIRAHEAVGAVHGPHGGGLLPHVLMVARVGLEYLAAVALPATLSPVYYYQRALVYDPVNFAAVGAIAVLAIRLVVRRRRYPWSFFCAAWFVLMLLPESNVVPLAQLRADRFLYLSMLGAGLWVAVQLERLPRTAFGRGSYPLASRAAGVAVVAALTLVTYRSATVWRSDVTAWTRVVERHPWCGMAYLRLGDAHRDAGAAPRAEAAYREALLLNADLPGAHLALAYLYRTHGERAAAAEHVQRYLEQVPDSAEGRALLEELRRGGP